MRFSFNPIHVIFGLKVRQARMVKNLSITELSELSGLSASYITEIEKGRKYPKTDRIVDLSEALGYDYDELVSLRLDPPLSFLETPLTSQLLQNFPLELFGVDPSTVVDVLTRSPAEMSALVRALQSIARGYAIREEHFYLAALRSYQEYHRNYFPELEKAAADYAAAARWHDTLPRDEAALLHVLRHRFNYEVAPIPVDAYPNLSAYRAVFQPGSRPRLLLNLALMPSQRKFMLAREIGYNVLELSERTSMNPPDEVGSFTQVLNDFKAAYFGGALLMPKAAVEADLRALFGMKAWDPQPLVQMLSDYDVTPETLLYRLSELVPELFGLKVHFLRFHEVDDNYRVYKQLNMNELALPTGFGLQEHYCRRWLTVRLLRELGHPGDTAQEPFPGIQRSRFLQSQKQFLCIGFSRRDNLPPHYPTSVILGIRIDDGLARAVKFANDPAIPEGLLNETCERCPLSADECGERAAPPTRWQQDKAATERQRELAALLERKPAPSRSASTLSSGESVGGRPTDATG